MGWGFDDIGDFFDAAGKVTLGAITGGASLAMEAVKAAAPGAPPPSPTDDPAAIAERDAKTREEALRRLLGGLDSNIATSPMGLTGMAQVSTKSLLGS